MGLTVLQKLYLDYICFSYRDCRRNLIKRSIKKFFKVIKFTCLRLQKKISELESKVKALRHLKVASISKIDATFYRSLGNVYAGRKSL